MNLRFCSVAAGPHSLFQLPLLSSPYCDLAQLLLCRSDAARRVAAFLSSPSLPRRRRYVDRRIPSLDSHFGLPSFLELVSAKLTTSTLLGERERKRERARRDDEVGSRCCS